MAGGWQISTIGTLRTSVPFGRSVQNGLLDDLTDNAPGSILHPGFARGASGVSSLYHPRKGQSREDGFGVHWLNEDAFAQSGQYRFGSASRTLPGVRAPATSQLRLHAGDECTAGGHLRSQFRWEMFSMFNTPQLRLPNQSSGSGDFGVIASARGRRILQSDLKLYF